MITFNTKVKVLKGFYKDSVGYVAGIAVHKNGYYDEFNDYTVEFLTILTNRLISCNFKETDLEVVKVEDGKDLWELT